VSTRQRGSSWQIFVAQSKPGGQVVDVKARHSVLGPHSEVEAQVWNSRQRPAVALVQYDAFSRGAAESLLASEGPLPTAEELGEQVEEFLAGLDGGDETS